MPDGVGDLLQHTVFAFVDGPTAISPMRSKVSPLNDATPSLHFKCQALSSSHENRARSISRSDSSPFRATIVIVSCALGVSSCSGVTYDSRSTMYDAGYSALDELSYNTAADHKAMICGDNVEYMHQCFMSSGYSTTSEAEAHALQNCRSSPSNFTCYTFARDGDLSSWVYEETAERTSANARAESGNGSVSGGAGSGWADFLGVATQGLSLGLGIAAAMNGGGVGASSNAMGYGSGRGDACRIAQENLRQCTASWQGIGGGSTGQAHAFQQCKDLYQAGVDKLC